ERAHGGRARPQLPRALRRDGPARLGAADHRMAVFPVARRIPAARDRVRENERRAAALPVLATLLAVALAAGALTLLATSGQSLLPVIMDGNRDAPAKLGVATACWMLSIVAIAALWRRRPTPSSISGSWS